MKKHLRHLSVLLFAAVLLFSMGIIASAEEKAQASQVSETFTGIKDLQYYVAGKVVAKKGWVKYNDENYYFSGGKALTGWNYVKDLSGSSKKYKYYFTKTGALSENLFKTFGLKGALKLRKKKMKVFVNLTTHNITLYLYDAKKKDYIVPVKSWVCSTARDGHSTRVGNYHIKKGNSTAWFTYKKSTPHHYYQYKVKIANTLMLFHSEMYGRIRNKKSLIVHTYNALGTNQTTRCIRQQCGNAYLLYRITKENKYPLPVKIYRSANKGPFGKKTLANSGGKLKKSQRYDPTDPKFNNQKITYY